MKKQYIIPEMASVEVVSLAALCNVSGDGISGVGGTDDGSGSKPMAPHRGGFLGPSYSY